MKNFFKAIIKIFILVIFFASSASIGFAKEAAPKILFIPQDSRPISSKQTAEVVQALGWEIIMPPAHLLGTKDFRGDSDGLWQWLYENLPNTNFAVLSSDALLYGSLVSSRQHNINENILLQRVNRFQSLKRLEKNKKMHIYVFGSIMRTPRTGAASGGTDSKYYEQYGSQIFTYTTLYNKKILAPEKWTRSDKRTFRYLSASIPQRALKEWMNRRSVNFRMNQKLIDLAKENYIDYLALGRDDNALYSQTQKESLDLIKYGQEIYKKKFQTMAGIDELALLMLARGANDFQKKIPLIAVKYNQGKGGDMIPLYSDEKISESIKAQIDVMNGVLIRNEKKANLFLLVNTNEDGETQQVVNEENRLIYFKKDVQKTKFVDLVEKYVLLGKHVCVADIAFSNGSDNAMMKDLQKRNLLFKLRSYAGWNTATNSTGYALAQGVFAQKMTDDACDKILFTRYLDDWGYQANVRNFVGRQLYWMRKPDKLYIEIGLFKKNVESRMTGFLRAFANKNLPPVENVEHLQVKLPWARLFEADFVFDER